MRSFVVLILLASCQPKPIDTTIDTEDPGPTCSFGVALVEPIDGATDVYYRPTVRVTLDDEDTDWTVTVIDANGDAVTSAPVEETPDHIAILPSLDPDSEYTIQIDYCGGQSTTSFTTSSVGTPMEDDTVLDGTVYLVDLASPRILKPENVGSEVLSVFNPFISAVRIDYSNDIMRLTAALMLDDNGTIVQDECSRTLTFPFDLAWNNPTFSFGKDRFTFPWFDNDVEVNDLAGSGTISPGLTGFEGMRVRGWIDVRELNGIIPGFEDAEDSEICELAAGLGLICEPCGGVAELPYCFTVSFEAMEGERIDAALIDITAEEVSLNKACTE